MIGCLLLYGVHLYHVSEVLVVNNMFGEPIKWSYRDKEVIYNKVTSNPSGT